MDDNDNNSNVPIELRWLAVILLAFVGLIALTLLFGWTTNPDHYR